MSSYNIKLSNGSTLLDIKPLEGNGLGNASTLLQVQDVEFKDISFGLVFASRPDAFIVSGDVRQQYLQGTVFTVSGNTGYDGTYTVALTGFNLGDQVAAFVNGQTHIPVASIAPGSFKVAAILSGGTKIKVLGVNNSENVFLPGRTLTITGNSFSAANGTISTIVSSISSSVYEADTTNVGTSTFTIVGDVTDLLAPNDLINITGTATGLGEGRYKIATVAFASGSTTVALNTTYKALPSGFAVSIKPKLSLATPASVITLAAAVPSGTTATGTVLTQAPSTIGHALSPTITGTTPHNYVVTWHIVGQLASQLVAGTIVQVKNARYNGVRYTKTFAITNVTQVAPNGTYPSGLTEVQMALTDPAAPTPVITADATSRFVFPIPAAPFGFISYGTMDVKTSLALVGQGSPSFNSTTTWGAAVQGNMVHLAENFASTVPPIAPLLGQIWFDTTTLATRVWHGMTLGIIAVTPGASGTWQIDGAAANLPAVGETLVVYNNPGMGLAPVEYIVASATQTTTPSTTTGFTTAIVVTGTIPAAADDQASPVSTAPYGNAYAKRNWKDLVTTDIPTLSNVDMNNFKIGNLADATADQDALNRRTGDARYVNSVGDSMSGNLTMTGASKIALDTGNVELALGNILLAGSTQRVSLGSATNGVIVQINGADAPSMSFNTGTASSTTGNAVINLGQNKIINLTNPSAALDAANKAYVDSLANGIIWLQPMVDPNLFDDSLTTPPVSPLVYTRTYIVPTGATGAWSSLVGRAVTWNGTSWIDVLGRAVVVGDRFGVLVNPDNDELSSLPAPGGGLATHAGQIATITALGPITYAFYTPHEPDAISVTGAPLTAQNQVNYSPHFGHSYTFRGTWGTGSYGINYQWIEFAGPQMLVDGAGLRYSGNVLNVGQGPGIIVGADSISVDGTFTDGQYVRLDGSAPMTGLLSLSGLPTLPGHAATKGYVDARVLDNLADVVISAPTLNQGLVFNGTNWVNSAVSAGSGGIAVQDIQIISSDLTTNLTVGTNKSYVRASRAGTLTAAKASVQTASTSGDVVVNVKKNGTTIFSTKITIEATELSSLTATALPVLSVTSVAADDLITVDIDSAGTGAKGLIVTLQFQDNLPTYTLDGLTDVVAPTPVTGDTLTFDGTNWVNTPINYYESLGVITPAAGAITIDARVRYATMQLTANVTSVSFTNLPPAGKACKIELRIHQDGTGGWTLALPASFKAVAGSDTTIQVGANAYTVITLKTFDQGTRWEYDMRAAAA